MKKIGSDENFSGVVQGVVKRKALTTIDGNIIPSRALHKKGNLTGELGDRCNKIPVVPSHRPVTRKSVKEQETSPKANDYIVIDTDEDGEDDLQDMSMHEQRIEHLLDEADLMDAEEDEMESETMDIDRLDRRDPLFVVEYIDDLYDHYKTTEVLSCVAPDYMSFQFDINEKMRAILIDWLIEVHYKFELLDETLYLTISVIDRFLAVKSVIRKKLQLVGVTAMLLACKYEEVTLPSVNDLIQISDRAYCRQELLDMEKMIVNTLQFNFSLPTPYVFMRRFLKAAQSDVQLEHTSYFLLELSLVEYEMLRFCPSLLAAAAIFTAECTISRRKTWSKTCERYTCYTEDELLECARLMVCFHEKAGTGKLIGVYKKYSTSNFSNAAKSTPATFLFDEF